MAIGDILSTIGKDKVDIKGQDDIVGTTFPVFKLMKEQLEFVQTVVIKKRNIGGDTLIWGNDTFGIWGSFKWGGTAQTSFVLGNPLAGILGTSKLGSQTSEYVVSRVVSPNNKFVDIFGSTEFIDTTNTTADTGTTNIVSFATGEELHSDIIFKNEVNIVSATILLTGTDVTNLTLYLSNDNGSTWEEVSNNIQNVFSSTGQSLKYKLVASDTCSITKIEVRYTI